MIDKQMQISELVWETLHTARVGLMTEAGYRESDAVTFADFELEWRKSMIQVMGPEAALLADLTWVKGEGQKIHWGFDVAIPPIPKDFTPLS